MEKISQKIVLADEKKPIKVKNKFLKKDDLIGWMIMLPTLILFAFFVWDPLIENIRLSLYKADGIRLVKFVGLDNYFGILKHPDFFAAFKNTFVYIGWSLVIGFIFPIIIAILISETVHLKGLLRVGIYFPNIMPGLATVIMWGFFFKPGPTGTLNILLEKIGVNPQIWLTNPSLTIPLIVISMTWKSAGATALIYLAGISGINPELYEAATIDGTTVLQRIRHITLPKIFSLAKTMLILQIISVFQILYEPMVMTNGGPNNASISIMQLVYNFAFKDYNFPAAAALSVVVCMVLIVLSGIYFKLTSSEKQ